MPYPVVIHMDSERLIQLVKERKCLWDPRSSCYKNRNLKKKLWVEIAREMGGSATVYDVKYKWKLLRDSFNRELRHLLKKEAAQTGDEETADVHPKWIYFKQLSFLKDVITRRLHNGKYILTIDYDDIETTSFNDNAVIEDSFQEDAVHQDNSNNVPDEHPSEELTVFTADVKKDYSDEVITADADESHQIDSLEQPSASKDIHLCSSEYSDEIITASAHESHQMHFSDAPDPGQVSVARSGTGPLEQPSTTKKIKVSTSGYSDEVITANTEESSQVHFPGTTTGYQLCASHSGNEIHQIDSSDHLSATKKMKLSKTGYSDEVMSAGVQESSHQLHFSNATSTCQVCVSHGRSATGSHQMDSLNQPSSSKKMRISSSDDVRVTSTNTWATEADSVQSQRVDERNEEPIILHESSTGDKSEDYHFLMSLLPSLERLPARKKMLVKSEMMRMLFEATFNTPLPQSRQNSQAFLL